MIPQIDIGADSIGGEYRFFTDAVTGVVSSFFLSTNFRYPTNRYMAEMRIQRVREASGSHIRQLVYQTSREVAQISLQRATETLQALGKHHVDKPSLERTANVLEFTIAEVQLVLASQLDRDARSAMSYLSRGSIDQNQVFGRSMGMSAIDRAGRNWDSERMARIATRHHLVMLANDVYVDALAEAGIKTFEITNGTEADTFNLDEYQDVRDQRLHPNTSYWVK